VEVSTTLTMSDFATLLGKFQDSSKQLSQKSRNKKDVINPDKKRPRLMDVKDFPQVEKIFLMCPAAVQTGGPEALHQLCDHLNRTTEIPAFMVYVLSEGSNFNFASRATVPIAYHNYLSPSVNFDPLQEGDQSYLMIWPECWTNEMLNYLATISNPNQCAIWWLSVDNDTYRFKEWHRKDIFHLWQSEYARQHLLKHGAQHVLKMTEYISDPPKPDKSIKRDIDVLFNPLKGVHYTDEIRKRSGTAMKFVPVGGGVDGRVRLSPRDVRKLLKRTKIYIDFGQHPGMDRLPREAALAGCLVVTNMEGAAFYCEDILLPPMYKIEKFDPEIVHKLLKELNENFQSYQNDLEKYRKWIRGQEKEMSSCISNLVLELVTNRTKKYN